jgi:hypothetical protein
MNALTSSKRSCLFVLLCSCTIGFTPCATSQESARTKLSRETTTLEAYSRAEVKLATVRPGDTLETLKSKGIVFQLHTVKSFGIATGERFIAEDGWIDVASGGYLGGLFGLGTLISLSSENIVGSHLFGYIKNGTYVIPKVELQIVGDTISKKEYSALDEAKTKNIGLLSVPGGSQIYAKNLRVHEVKQLDFPPGPDLNTLESKTTSVKQHFISKLTPAEFEKSKSILEKMPPGTDIYGAIRALDGWYFCMRPGDGSACVLWMSGFLNLEDKFRFSVVKTGDALYNVWAFGYLDAEQHEVPKLALILRNGKVSNLVPYTDRASIEAQLRP